MKQLLQIDFDFSGPFGEEMAAALQPLAESINQEPGFLWKIWTENPTTKEAGGIYLFADETSAQAYLHKHTARLAQFGVHKVNAKCFTINEPLSTLNKGPV